MDIEAAINLLRPFRRWLCDKGFGTHVETLGFNPVARHFFLFVRVSSSSFVQLLRTVFVQFLDYSRACVKV